MTTHRLKRWRVTVATPLRSHEDDTVRAVTAWQAALEAIHAASVPDDAPGLTIEVREVAGE